MITEEQYQALPEETRSIYSETEDGFTIKPPANDDLSGLKSNQAQLIKEKKDLKERLKVLEEDNDAALQTKLEEQGQYKELMLANQKSFDTKLAASVEAQEHAESALSNLVLDTALDQLAASLSDSPDLIKPHIKNRLRTSKVDGNVQIEVLDASGNLSLNTLDELKVEFENSESYQPLLKARGSKGSGTQVTDQKHHSEYEKYFDPKSTTYDLAKQIELKVEDKEQYDALTKKYNLDDIFSIIAQGQGAKRGTTQPGRPR